MLISVLEKQLVSFDWSNNTSAIVKIGALIHSVMFFSPEVALYPFKFMYSHAWAGAPSCYLELLDKLQKWICRTVGSSLAASLKHLAHR